MRPLLVTLVLLALCVAAGAWYREQARARYEAARVEVQPVMSAPSRSLEERAAAAQGTVLPAQVPRPASRRVDASIERVGPAIERASEASSEPRFRCDGRTRCPQMHSCEEATWFLQNCSGMKMDGDGDGVPCESQWCPGG